MSLCVIYLALKSCYPLLCAEEEGGTGTHKGTLRCTSFIFKQGEFFSPGGRIQGFSLLDGLSDSTKICGPLPSYAHIF